MPTPLINSLRVQGGTFYTFTSASNDLAKANVLADGDKAFVFSKYVLLNIPKVETPTNNKNSIVWESIGATGSTYPNSSVPLSDINVDNNINLAQSFQNYVLNKEQMILQGLNTLGQSYNQDELYTTPERIFWKWMASINAMRFREATAAESNESNRYVEEDPSESYNRVVKYIGDIDLVNNVSKGGQSYSEVYLNVPVTHGNTPLILFKTLSDSNYSPGRIWTNGSEFIVGRDSGSTHPTGLSLQAYYDSDITDQYISKPSFGDVSNFSGFASADPLSIKPILRSNMDGIIIDTNASTYKPITDNLEISTISEFNATEQSSDFQFNAALIYYDIYDKSTPEIKGRNLFGILILDDFVNQGSTAELKTFDKFKPNKITKLNGNGYGLKLNVKYDTTANNIGVETIINDYNTFSMDLFIDASNRMQEAADMFIKQNVQIIELKKKIDELKSFYFSQADINEIKFKIDEIERIVNNSNAAFESSSTLLDLINNNTDNINSIISGNLSTPLSINLDIIKKGLGINLDKSTPGEVRIINRVQTYNNFMVCENSTGFLSTSVENGQNIDDENNSNILILQPFTNYFKQINQNIDPLTGIESFDDNLIININDKTHKWKTGQTLKLVFENPINFNGYSLIFRGDWNNIFGQGKFGKILGTVTEQMILSNRPIIELICTDETQYEFNIDILR